VASTSPKMEGKGKKKGGEKEKGSMKVQRPDGRIKAARAKNDVNLGGETRPGEKKI